MSGEYEGLADEDKFGVWRCIDCETPQKPEPCDCPTCLATYDEIMAMVTTFRDQHAVRG